MQTKVTFSIQTIREAQPKSKAFEEFLRNFFELKFGNFQGKGVGVGVIQIQTV